MEPEPVVNVKSKLSLPILVTLVLLFGTLSFAFYLFFSLQDQAMVEKPVPTSVPENHEQLFRESIRQVDSGVIEQLPSASVLPNTTEQDAAELFAVSRISNVFDFGDRTVEYLVRILDSDSPEVEPYKTIAAYFLVHSFYDTRGDIEFMANAVAKSTFMVDVTTAASEVFPQLFATPLADMSYPEKSLYFTAYLLALSERPDSVAVPGNALLELARAYVQMSRDENSALFQYMTQEQIADLFNQQWTVYNERMTSYNLPLNREPSEIEAHDILVGINTGAGALTLIRKNGFAEMFPDTIAADLVGPLGYSRSLARDHVPSLYMFTSYLNLRNFVTFPLNLPREDEAIEEIVKNMIGEYPYSNVTADAWVNSLLQRAGEDDIYTNYLKADIKEIARRSSNFARFLSLRGLNEYLE